VSLVIVEAVEAKTTKFILATRINDVIAQHENRDSAIKKNKRNRFSCAISICLPHTHRRPISAVCGTSNFVAQRKRKKKNPTTHLVFDDSVNV
jgi:hypothetical protein